MSSKKNIQKQKMLVAALLITVAGAAVALMGPGLVATTQTLWSDASGPQAMYKARNNAQLGNKRAVSIPIESPQPVYPLPSEKPNPIPTPPPVNQNTCPEDINMDHFVNQPDFDILKANYGKQGTDIQNTRADINRDNKVTLVDFSLLASAFGKNCN